MKEIKIEFNETGNINSLMRIEDMSNKEVNEEIINQFILCEEVIEEAKYNGLYDGGYFKTYFELYENEGLKQTIKIDLGDGMKVNGEYYDYLKRWLK